MDFELSDLQTELADGMRRLCEGRYNLPRIRRFEGAGRVVDRDSWKHLADAGVFSLRLPESAGGTALGLAEAALVYEELGRALVPGPLVATHLAAGTVDGAADGTTVVGMVEVSGNGGGTGRRPPIAPLLLEHLEDLDLLLVLDDRGVVAVEPDTLGAVRLQRPMDPLTPLWSVPALPRGTPVTGPDEAVRWQRDGTVLTAALQVGIAAWLTDLAAEYAKHRQQFGRPIGSFQAVKHLCADMAVRTELARCALHAAAVTADQPDVGDPVEAAAAAKLLADEAALLNGRSCIQVHGGMGFTWEIPAHLGLKRARLLGSRFGTADRLADQLASSIPLPAGSGARS